MTNVKKNIGIIMTVIGSILLAVGLILFISFLLARTAVVKGYVRRLEEMDAFVTDAKPTMGTIQAVESGKKPMTTIRYKVDGESYYVTATAVSSRYQVGDLVEVYYDPADANQCVVPDLHVDSITPALIVLLMSMVVGVVIAVVGLGILIGGIVLLKQSKSRV